ncbi:MAG: group II intron reverse transcriptase/maturase [Candidatus Omnitrophica bacterium]|nr:group II intron reverse transcriptase/maturase [Candidatus Omnitrophota bacterium]
MEAYRLVKSRKGTGGIDEQTIEEFESKLKDNLYKLWNRMSSGSYMPAAVRGVEIPKANGGTRRLGIPTVTDRIAQTVVKLYLEPNIEPLFHPDSYGYRMGKSAQQAIGRARQRCWKHDWVIDLDIKGFFDTIDHNLMMSLVRKHTEEKWVHLYVSRWLQAPMQIAGQGMEERRAGTPQGGVISPLLANLYLHYAFDQWMAGEFPTVAFERYADDIVIHCRTEKQARYVLGRVKERIAMWKLIAHPEKTRIVYCKDGQRTEEYPEKRFDFLGYEFRGRSCKSRSKGQLFFGFTPAISPKSLQAIGKTIRSWELSKQSPLDIKAIAEWMNPIVRGWYQYYGAYGKSALGCIRRQIDHLIARWAMRKYAHLHRKFMVTLCWLKGLRHRKPELFAHWA